jgi:hypothetical protein
VNLLRILLWIIAGLILLYTGVRLGTWAYLMTVENFRLTRWRRFSNKENEHGNKDESP